MQVKVKKLNSNAVINTYANQGDAGIDLTAVSKSEDTYGNVVYGTGLAFEIPEGYVGLLFPRSSISKKHLILTNSVGVIDSGYRGEVMMKFKPIINGNSTDTIYNIGERIGQLIIVPYPSIELIEADTLSETKRGNGSYGSTGQ